MKFRSKPVVIEAQQLTSEQDADRIGRWVIANGGNAMLKYLGNGPGNPDIFDGLLIHTLEGGMRADVGDWIIRGTRGEFYPCKPDVFAVKYEPVASSSPERADPVPSETQERS